MRRVALTVGIGLVLLRAASPAQAWMGIESGGDHARLAWSIGEPASNDPAWDLQSVADEPVAPPEPPAVPPAPPAVPPAAPVAPQLLPPSPPAPPLVPPTPPLMPEAKPAPAATEESPSTPPAADEPVEPAESPAVPQDAPLPPVVTAEPQPTPADNAGESPMNCCSACCPAPAPWKLPQPGVFQRLGVDVGGWVQQGITFNGDHPADGYNGPIATNDFANTYQLNQAWLYLVKPTNTGGCGWDVGGRFDLVWGTDWRFGANYGLEDRIDGNNDYYGLVIPQMYLEVAVNDLTIRLGHFATFTSYEVVPAPLNFFYSHAYCMTGYFDPLLVTGMMTDYHLTDNVTVLNGFHRGELMYEDVNNDLNYLGGVKWASDSKADTLSAMVDTGPQDPAGVQDRTSLYLVYTHRFNECYQYALQYTTGFENGGSVVSPGEDAEWYGLAQWLFYTINPKWSIGARFEWMRDDDGSRIFGVGNMLGSNKACQVGGGFAGDFYDMTLGLNWRPHPNFLFRPEVRWDWYDGPANPLAQLPFDAGTDRNQFTTGMDLIFTF